MPCAVNFCTADADPFVALVQQQLGASAAQPSAGAYGVQIMQMSSGGTPAQAQLAVVAAPEPTQGVAMALLGFGGLCWCGWRAVRRDAERKELERREPAV